MKNKATSSVEVNQENAAIENENEDDDDEAKLSAPIDNTEKPYAFG